MNKNSKELLFERMGIINPDFKEAINNNFLKDRNGEDLIVFHGSGSDFEVKDFKTNDVGYHFGNIKQAWNWAADRMKNKYEYGNEEGLMYGLDYEEIVKPYKLKGNFGGFIDLDTWTVSKFRKEFDDFADSEKNDSVRYNDGLTPYENLNRKEIKELLGADVNADLDGVYYVNEYDSNELRPYEVNDAVSHFRDLGFSDDEIKKFFQAAKSKMSYLVFNKNSIVPVKK